MPSPILWGILWALPVMVAIVAIPFYMRLVRTRRVSVMRAIAIVVVVIAVANVMLVASWAIASTTSSL